MKSHVCVHALGSLSYTLSARHVLDLTTCANMPVVDYRWECTSTENHSSVYMMGFRRRCCGLKSRTAE